MDDLKNMNKQDLFKIVDKLSVIDGIKYLKEYFKCNVFEYDNEYIPSSMQKYSEESFFRNFETKLKGGHNSYLEETYYVMMEYIYDYGGFRNVSDRQNKSIYKPHFCKQEYEVLLKMVKRLEEELEAQSIYPNDPKID